MTLDDVYGPDEEQFPLEQDAEEWDESLEWEESEAQDLCREIAGQR